MTQFAWNPLTNRLDVVNATGGDVVGPGSSVDGDIVLFNGTSGNAIKDSGVNQTGIFTLTTSGIATGGGLVALGGTVNVNVPSSGFTTSDVSGAFTSAANNRYFIIAGATTTLPTDASSTNGDTIEYILDTNTPNALVITAAAGQSIRIGTNVSSVGGTATSNGIGSTVELIYRKASLTWISGDNNGSWSLA